MSVKRLTQMAMLTAISIVLAIFVRFPLFPAAPWMLYDPADVPIFVGTLLFGPGAGLAMAGVAGLIVHQGGPLGIIMHFASTGGFVLVAGLLYRFRKTPASAAVALLVATAATCAIMVGLNLLVVPLFAPAMDWQDVVPMILPVILPFNALKYTANSVLAYVLWRLLQKYRFI